MNELTKTIVFVVVGSLLVATAFGVHVLTQPEESDDFALVGEEFFPEFDSPSAARFLEIVAFDFEKREPKDFRVEYKDRMWRIPSHHGYPAEAADHLAQTAASVMGIRREAISGRRESEHRRFGVIDPTSDDAKKISKSEKGAVGVRVTIGKGNGDVLADYIIGKEVEARELDDEFLREIRGEEEKKPLHYVRRPDEKETYIASMEIDASTKFSDWIEPDLLLLDENNLRQLVIKDYSFETKVEEVEVLPGVFQQVSKPEKVDGESYTLTKDGNFRSWELEGLDEETEELETTKISDLTRSLDNLNILGVRPRVKIDGQPILTQDLKIEFPESIRSQGAAQRAIQQVAVDLENKGFILSQDPNDQSLSIASDQGELSAATSEGAVYRLYFGKVFTGTDTEIEIGAASQEGEEKDDAGDADTGEDNESESEENTESDSANNGDFEEEGNEEDSDKQKSRYLLVRVEFGPEFIGEQPTPPVEPKEPQKPNAKEEEADGDNGEQPEPPPAEKSETTSKPSKDEAEKKEESDTTDNSGDAPASEENPTDSGEDEKEAGDQDKKESTAEDQEDKKDSEVKDDTKEDPEAKYQEALQEYQLAKIQYQQDKTQYEKDLQEYEEKVAEGKNKVAKLNQRFADWYYVIPAESLENLRLSRNDLVREKEEPDEDKKDEDKKDEDKKDEDKSKLDKPADDAAAANQKAADEFLAENKSKDGIVTTDSGLQYKVLQEGEGEAPKATSRVKVKYQGTLLDGTVFDQSGDEPVEFGVNQVIQGWTEALQLMKPGAKWRLFIPPGLAYGESGSGPKIGPNSLLIFEVELISIQ